MKVVILYTVGLKFSPHSEIPKSVLFHFRSHPNPSGGQELPYELLTRLKKFMLQTFTFSTIIRLYLIIVKLQVVNKQDTWFNII